jgi:chromosomal replication initiator protein
VVGSSNRFAHAASLAVASIPAKTYNPLLLHGEAGVGKTHLLRAIGHHLQAQSDTRHVVYVTAEHFTHELAHTLQQRRMEWFRARYRQAEVLLVDDIEFFAGKDRTQEEFLHTFNALYDAGRQIVMASARSPQAITPLQERLRSRLTCGVIADLQPPDLEMRVAILVRKAAEQGLLLPPDAVMVVASRVEMNIRELEGCLARIGAYASLHARDIDEELVTTVLRELHSAREQVLTVRRVQETVAAYFGIEASALVSRSRQRSVTFPRQVAMFLCRDLLDASLQEIGRAFGGKNHTTILHAYAKMARLEKKDAETARLLWRLRRTLGERL